MSAPGSNYGLNGDYEYNEIEINSRDATQSYNGSYTSLNWPKITLGKPLGKVAAIKVLQAVVPFTYYVINSTNNSFSLFESFGGGGGTVTLEPGTYSGSELAIELKRALEVPGAWTYTVTYSETSGKFSIEITGGSSSFVFPDWQKFQYLGANQNDTGSFTNAPFPGAAELNGPPYLYLNSSVLGSMINVYLNGNGIVNPPGTGSDGPQIAKIPMNVTSRGKNIIYNDPDPEKWFYLGNDDFPTSFDLYLTAGTYNQMVPLNLNGEGFTVKLGILTNKMERERDLNSTYQTDRVTTIIRSK